MKLFSGFEPYSFARSNGDFGARPRIASDSGFSRFNSENAEAAKLDAIAGDERLFHALEDRINRSLCFCSWQAGTFNNPLYKILLYHFGPPSLAVNFGKDSTWDRD
jgi:hypothetical protein